MTSADPTSPRFTRTGGFAVAAAVVAVAALVAAVPGWTDAWGWETGGSPLRLLTSQLSHWNLSHLLWDACGVAICGWFLPRWRAARATVVLCLVIIPPVVVVAQPELVAFRGHSGVASGLFAAALVHQLRSAAQRGDTLLRCWYAMFLIGFLIKLAFECVTGSCLFVADDAGFAAVPLAHALGAGIGAAVATCPCSRLPFIPSSCSPSRNATNPVA